MSIHELVIARMACSGHSKGWYHDPKAEIILIPDHTNYEPIELNLDQAGDDVELCVPVIYMEATDELDKPSFTMVVRMRDMAEFGRVEVTSRDIRGEFDWFYRTLRFRVPGQALVPGETFALFVELEAEIKVWSDTNEYDKFTVQAKTEHPIEIRIQVPESTGILPPPFESTRPAIEFKCVRGAHVLMRFVPWEDWSRLEETEFEEFGEVDVIENDIMISWKEAFTTIFDATIRPPGEFTLRVYELENNSTAVKRELYFFHTTEQFGDTPAQMPTLYNKAFRDFQNWQWWESLMEEDVIPFLDIPSGRKYEFAIRPVGPISRVFRWQAKIEMPTGTPALVEKTVEIFVAVSDFKRRRADDSRRLYDEYQLWKFWGGLGLAAAGEVIQKGLELLYKSNLIGIIIDLCLDLIDSGVKLYYYTECKNAKHDAIYGCDIPFDRKYDSGVRIPRRKAIVETEEPAIQTVQTFMSAFRHVDELHEAIDKMWNRYLSALRAENGTVAERHLSDLRHVRSHLDRAVVDMQDIYENISSVISENVRLDDNVIAQAKKKMKETGLSEAVKKGLSKRGYTPEKIAELEKRVQTEDLDTLDFSFLTKRMTGSVDDMHRSGLELYLKAVRTITKMQVTASLGEGDILIILLGHGLITYDEFSAKLEGIGKTRSLSVLPNFSREKQRLADHTIGTTWQLLRMCSSPTNREHCSEQTGIKHATLLRMANIADLLRIPSMDPLIAVKLEKAGVDTVKELAQRNAAQLYAKLSRVKGIPKKLRPTLEQIKEWKQRAKKLKRVLTY